MKEWLEENTALKCSCCSSFPWNIQSKYRNSFRVHKRFCTAAKEAFPTRTDGWQCLGSTSSPQRGAGSAQSNPRMCLTFPLSHYNCCSLAGPREWVCFGGHPVPPELHPQLKESMDGWLSFSHGMASKLSMNDPQEEHRMKWFTVVFSSQVEGAHLFFSKGRSRGSLPAHVAGDIFNLLLWTHWSASSCRDITSLPLIISWGASSSEREEERRLLIH